MNMIKQYKLLIGIIVLLTLGVAGYDFYQQAQPVYFDADVKEHYQLFEAKYNYSDCRIWIDYSPQRPTKEFDYQTYKIIQDTIVKYNKYMVYSDQKDFGGKPGIHLAFADFCEQAMELGEKIAVELIENHSDISSAHAVLHTKDRDHFDTGKPFMPYLKELMK